MGKKKLRTKYVSKGQRRSVSKKITKAVRREYMSSFDRVLNQLDALLDDKRVMITRENSNPNEKKARYIREKAITPRDRKDKRNKAMAEDDLN